MKSRPQRPSSADKRPPFRRPLPVRLPLHPAVSAPIIAAFMLAPGVVFMSAPAPSVWMNYHVTLLVQALLRAGRMPTSAQASVYSATAGEDGCPLVKR
jgi:hypothetical protein